MNYKITVLFFLFFYISFASLAQNILFGIKAGPQYSTAYGDMATALEVKPMLGWHAGGYAQFVLKKKLSLQTEICFAHRGYYRKYGASFDNSIQGQDKKILNYLDLPVLLNFGVPSNFTLSVGLMPSLFLNGKLVSQGKEYPATIATRYSSVSALAGVSYAIKKFDVGLRYSIDFTNIFQQNHIPLMFLQSYLSYNLNKK